MSLLRAVTLLLLQPLFAGKLYRSVSRKHTLFSLSLSFSSSLKYSAARAVTRNIKNPDWSFAHSARRVFAQHRFPPSPLYFPRIALNVFAKIGLPLISLPTLPPCPLLYCHIFVTRKKKKREKKPPSVLIDHSTWNVSHRPAQRRKSDGDFAGNADIRKQNDNVSASCFDIKHCQRGSTSET